MLRLLLKFTLESIDWFPRKRMYGAGKVGGLSRLYQSLGMSICFTELAVYKIGNVSLGKYELLCLDQSQVSSALQLIGRKVDLASPASRDSMTKN